MPTCATYHPLQSLTAFQNGSVGSCNAGIRCTYEYSHNTTQTTYTQYYSTSSEPSVIHMNGRAYAPGLQRFLSPDPVLQAPANAQNHNRYAYCLNNPLRYTDPSGYFSVEELREILDEMHRLLDEANRMDLQLCVSFDGLGGGASGFGSVGGQLYSYENGTASLTDIGMPFYHMHEGGRAAWPLQCRRQLDHHPRGAALVVGDRARGGRQQLVELQQHGQLERELDGRMQRLLHKMVT